MAKGNRVFRFDVEDRHDSTKACPYKWAFAEDESGPTHGVYYLRHRTLSRRFKVLTRKRGAESMSIVVESYPIARPGEQKMVNVDRDYGVPKKVTLGDMAHNVIESLCDELMRGQVRRVPTVRVAGLRGLSRNGHLLEPKKGVKEDGPVSTK